MTAHEFLISVRLEDKYIGIPRFSSAIPVDATAVCVSELMEYWLKQGAKNTEPDHIIDTTKKEVQHENKRA
jgi:hypothetical protein